MFDPGIRPLMLGTAGLGDAAGTLRLGQTFQLLVQGAADDIWIMLAGQRLSLGTNSELIPGQWVRAEIVASERGAQIQVTPLPQPTETSAFQAAPSPSLPSGLAGMLASVLENLGALSAAAHALRLLPGRMPRAPESVRQVLSLFLQEVALGEDVAKVTAIVTAAVEAGVLREEPLHAMRSMFPDGPELSRETLVPLLKKAADDRTLEAVLGRAIEGNNLDKQSALAASEWRTLLGALRNDPTLTSWLKGKGQWRAFEQSAVRLLDRLAAGRLQNLHSLDQAYLYIEVPLPPDSGITRAQLHVFGDAGRGKGRGFDKENASVVLDLATTQLGPLWVLLRMAGGQCACLFRAENPGVVQYIAENAPELREALRAAGYQGATIDADLWDGDRGRETANLMQRFAGIDMNA